MIERRESEQDTALARTEILLNQAADFVPAESAPENLAMRALARWKSAGHDCSPRLKRNFIPAVILALAGVVLICFLSRPGSESLPALAERMALEVTPAPFETTPTTPSFALQHTDHPRENGLRSPSPSARYTRFSHDFHRRARPAKPPKAIWTVETVQTQQVGVLYTVWSIEDDAPSQAAPDERRVYLKPGLLSIPLQSQISICQLPSASPFPMQPPIPVEKVAQAAETTRPDSNMPNSSEEKTRP